MIPTVLVLDQPTPEINIDGSANMNEAERLAYFAQNVALFTGTSFYPSAAQCPP
ncbi:amino acid adenylation domain-containing protein [Pectobacterium atrosepticum ICMP 1526]|nr:hypothetical protein [Pectobacterium atrosepticum]KMK80090.1 amino acid adenylation domain-containing protein [Pectobacterium atrosepticum ICMP 1526]